MGEGHCAFQQITGHDPVEEFLPGHSGKQLALHWLAADNDVECGFHPENPGQTLRAASTGKQPQLDFRQRNAGPRCRHPVMAAQG